MKNKLTGSLGLTILQLISTCIMCVHYHGGYSIPLGVTQYHGGYLEYRRGYSIPWGILNTIGVFSTMGDTDLYYLSASMVLYTTQYS